MTIAVVCLWARALRAVITTVGVAGGACLVHRWWTGPLAKNQGSVRPVNTNGL